MDTPDKDQGSHPVAAPVANASARLRWVPIRSLAVRHRPRIAAHLLSLPEHDRFLRFGYAASDAQIGHYVDGIDFEHDEVFGIFNRRLKLIAAAHLAALPGAEKAEFGVSVLAGSRGRGYGSRLFDHAVLHARNRGITMLVIHALSENKAMLRIVRAAGASVESDRGESQAHLSLPPDDLRSHLEELVEDSAAEIDFRLKREAQRVGQVLGVFAQIKP